MLTRITCPHCGHVGATAASLPRVLICSQCEHGALIRSGTPARSPTVEREERAAERAAWERLAPPATASEGEGAALPHGVNPAREGIVPFVNRCSGIAYARHTPLGEQPRRAASTDRQCCLN